MKRTLSIVFFILLMFGSSCCMYMSNRPSMNTHSSMVSTEVDPMFDAERMDNFRIFLLNDSEVAESRAQMLAMNGHVGMALVSLDYHVYLLSGILDKYSRFKSKNKHLLTSEEVDDKEQVYSLNMLLNAISTCMKQAKYYEEKIKERYVDRK